MHVDPVVAPAARPWRTLLVVLAVIAALVVVRQVVLPALGCLT